MAAPELRFRDVRPTEVGAEYWERTARGELPLMRCDRGHLRIYLTRVCPACGSTAWTWTAASGRGTIYASTENAYALSDEFDAPYVVALVDLDEGVRMMANILGATAVDAEIGTPVELAFETLADGKRLPQFVIAEGAS
jgi:uncharacterized OB-fold protein